MVRTRFAPSPTGYLHIGGVRTALFCWLYARRHGGKFVLRLDDTDRERNIEEAIQPILHGLRWLGIDWDEGMDVGGDYGPYRQSERDDRYQDAVERLLASGHAYLDFASTGELQAEREAAQAAKRNFVYSRKWMAETEADAERFRAEGRAGVVRLKMPREGVCAFHDEIRGDVEFEWAREQDHVIRRADGSCLYHLANVVDDHDMAISHVIRAEEHLSNTPRQIFIAQSLGIEPPTYAHLPFVAEPGSRNKLSKRKLNKYLKNPDFAKLHARGVEILEQIGQTPDPDTFNPVIVGFYEDIGFVPEALVNYLLLLGWSLDDRTEDFTREQMIEHFSLERVNKAPASFDPMKLLAFQERRMQEVPAEKKVAHCLPYLVAAGHVAEPVSESDQAKVAAIVAGAGDRIKMAGDVLDYPEFFTADADLTFEEKAFTKRLVKPEDAVGLLTDYAERLRGLSSFDAQTLDDDLHAFVEEREIGMGKIIHALRVAVTGKGVGFGVFESLAILGPASCLARIERALDAARNARAASADPA